MLGHGRRLAYRCATVELRWACTRAFAASAVDHAMSSQIERAIRLKSMEKRRKAKAEGTKGSQNDAGRDQSTGKKRTERKSGPSGSQAKPFRSAPSRTSFPRAMQGQTKLRRAERPPSDHARRQKLNSALGKPHRIREKRFLIVKDMKGLLRKADRADQTQALLFYEEAERKFEALPPFVRRDSYIYLQIIKQAFKVQKAQRALQLVRQVRLRSRCALVLTSR